MNRTVLLGDVADINPESVDRSYKYDKILYLDTSSVTENTFSELQNFAIQDAPSRAKRIIRNGDIVYSTVRPNLKHFGYIKEPAENTVASTGFAVVRAKPGTDSEYLYYWLASGLRTEYLTSIAGSQTTTFPAFNPSILAKLKLVLPDLRTQKKIAGILGKIDEKIELNRKMNQTLEQMGQALFRHYFIDNPKADKWAEKTIGMLCDVKIGRTPPRKEPEWFDKDNGETWISIKDMGRGMTFIADSSEYLTKHAVEKFRIPAIEPNTILLSFKLTVGRLCVSTTRMYSNEAIAQLPIKSDEVSVEYLYYFLRNFNYHTLSNTSSIATAVNSNTVKNIKVPVPEITTMDEFVSRIHDTFEAMKNNETEIKTLTRLRDGLLPRLISRGLEVQANE